MSIGKSIFELRRLKKMTQGQLAEKLGVTEQSVSKWENDICAPDVSHFPALAKLFGVSIDRIFNFHLDTYDKAAESIIEKANESEGIYKQIEILSEGLKSYPNSDKIKTELAFALSMINRITEDEAERKNALDKAIGLCGEVIGTSGDTERIDEAFNLLFRIYNEIGDFDKALDALEKLSPAKYYMRITGKSYILAGKKDVEAQLKYSEKEMFLCWLTMTHLLRSLTSSLYYTSGEYEKALKFHKLYRRLLEVFDDGCGNFYAAYKLWECEEAAQIHMKLGDKESCIGELKRFLNLCDDVRQVAKSESYKITDRNRYFSDMEDENLHEEYLASAMDGDHIRDILKKYKEFLGNELELIEGQYE